MKIRMKDVAFCLEKAKEMAEEYQRYAIAGDGFPRRVDDFTEICTKCLGHKIVLKELLEPAGDGSIRAAFMAVEVGYEIYLSPDMDEVWRRFVQTKEVFHTLHDGEEYHNIERLSLYDHIRSVILPSTPDDNKDDNYCSASELMAEIAAMEFLFPYERRLIELRNGAGSVNYRAIAEAYKIPQFYVEQYLSKPWMDFLGAFYKPTMKS